MQGASESRIYRLGEPWSNFSHLPQGSKYVEDSVCYALKFALKTDRTLDIINTSTPAYYFPGLNGSPPVQRNWQEKLLFKPIIRLLLTPRKAE